MKKILVILITICLTIPAFAEKSKREKYYEELDKEYGFYRSTEPAKPMTLKEKATLNIVLGSLLIGAGVLCASAGSDAKNKSDNYSNLANIYSNLSQLATWPADKQTYADRAAQSRRDADDASRSYALFLTSAALGLGFGIGLLVKGITMQQQKTAKKDGWKLSYSVLPGRTDLAIKKAF